MTNSITGELVVERDGAVAIVELRPKLTLGCGLRKTVKELAQSGVRCVLLDFSKVTQVDSSGLGELVAGHTSVKQAGGGTILLNVNHQAKELLRFTRLSSVFPAYDGAASIVRSVLSNRPSEVRSSAVREAEACMLSEVYIG
jgi:anti-anti-sigma factor